MFIRLIAIMMFSLCLASGISAQQKVGSTGLPFLLFSPSVRGIAMGNTTVTSYDNRSYYLNPGTLAMMDQNKLSLSFNPITPKLSNFGSINFKVHTEALAIRLIGSRWGKGSFTLAFGYMFTTYSVGPFKERTYSYPDGTGRLFEVTNRDHSFSLGAGYKGSFEIGIGTTMRYLYEESFDVSLDGFAIDIGTMIRLPLVGSLSGYGLDANGTRLSVRAGVSVTNLGSGLSNNFGVSTLPTRGRFGLGLDFASKWLSLTPTLEVTVANNNDPGDLRLGMEAGYKGTIFVRAGRVNENDNGFSETSYGFGFSTRRIRESVAEKADDIVVKNQDLFQYVVRNINLSFSFAHLDTDRIGFDDPNFYQIELTL